MTEKSLVIAARRRWLGRCLILGKLEYHDFLFPQERPKLVRAHDEWFYDWFDTPEGIVFNAMVTLSIGAHERLDIMNVWRTIEALSWGRSPRWVRKNVGPAFLASLTDGVVLPIDVAETPQYSRGEEGGQVDETPAAVIQHIYENAPIGELVKAHKAAKEAIAQSDGLVIKWDKKKPH